MSKLAGIPRSSILAAISILLFVVASTIGAVIVGGMGGDPNRQATIAIGVSGTVSTSTLAVMASTPQENDPAATPMYTGRDETCATIWGIQPPANLPQWLTTPAESAGLRSETKYFLLAGRLITAGIASAIDCSDGGLTTSGAASTCGMEKTLPQVIEWQNQFDTEIFQAARENNIPAQLIKRLFAQETQFWPSITMAPPAYGIGNVTSPGVEPLFTWYPDIYQDICQDVFSKNCAQPYHSLSLDDQQILRGFFISQYLHAYCPDCAYDMDIDKIKGSIDYFAKLLISNCHQVDLILNNHGYSASGVGYADAWRVTLANYTAGAGCVSNAIEEMDVSREFTWNYFVENIAADCHVENYVNRITGDS